MSTPTDIPTIRRNVIATPRRTATDTWTTIALLFKDFFRGYELEELLEIVLCEVSRQAHWLIALQELMRVEITSGSSVCVAVDVAYGSLEAEDDLEPPLVPISELSQSKGVEIALVVRDRLQEMRDVIGLMSYRAPEGVCVCLRNEHAAVERRDPEPVPDPIQF